MIQIIRTFASRNLDIQKDTHYLHMIYSTMVGIRYMHFCQEESIKFCKFWYQIRTFDKTCSYVPFLVNPRYRLYVVWV